MESVKSSIGVISDIHGSVAGLEAAVDVLNRRKVNEVVFLGDLWTYGCSPNEVVETLRSLMSTCNVHFIKGNHDQFYFDLELGKDPFSYRVPEFVRESVFWTKEQVGLSLAREFEWTDYYVINGCYFAHANPYEYGNWQYLNTIKEHCEAGKSLVSLGANAGFFGHTHRKKVALYSKSKEAISFYNEHGCPHVLGGNDELSIVNPGSVGQPRGEGASMCIVEQVGTSLEIDMVELDVDFIDEIRKIEVASLTQATKDKLISYISKVN